MIKRRFSTQQFRDFKQQVARGQELKARDQELNTLMARLNQATIDFKTGFEQAAKMHRGEFTQEDIDKLEAEEAMIQQKLKEAEKGRKYISFFNKSALALIAKTPSVILCELGVRSFSGSRDVPQDIVKAEGLFEHAAINADEEQRLNVHYFKVLMDRFKLQQEWLQNRGNIDTMPGQQIVQLNHQLRELAQQGNALAAFSYAKQLFTALQEDQLDESGKEQCFQAAYQYFMYAAHQGVHNAHFYLGMIYYEGIYVQHDPDIALDHYIRGAAKNNAFCYFELSRIYGEGIIAQRNPALSFLYLKHAAEEGFVAAQHYLGIAYTEGINCQKHDQRALAWFRESVRNGNPVSYLNAAELLKNNNRLFSFVNYLGAYQHGALFVQPQIEELREQLMKEEGFRIPEIRFADEQSMKM